ncbi:hypothetical protein RJ639_043828, partial [Escallonia herrerae]
MGSMVHGAGCRDGVWPTPSTSVSKKLILYSMPGCCLCDGLKEKLHAAFSLSGPSSLHDIDLQVTLISVMFRIFLRILIGKGLTSMRFLYWLESALMELMLVLVDYLLLSVKNVEFTIRGAANMILCEVLLEYLSSGAKFNYKTK